MGYIDYAYYSGTYGGDAVSEAEFTRSEAKSRLQIDRHTFNRVRYAVSDDPEFEVPEDVKLAQCAIMDYMKSVEANGGKILASETVSKHSESYVGVKSFDEEIRDIVKQYLGGTPWTYRGGGAGIVH